jgi:enamine deaminase RidA (YjgF/YER057c/UK114 family)
LSRIDKKLAELGLELPNSPAPMASYVPAVTTGNLVFLSGVVSKGPEGLITGKLGRDLTVDEGYEGAKTCALNLLANLKNEIGDLDKVKRIVKLLGMVNSVPEFTQPPAVINGCSDLLVELFGKDGEHARSAVGVATLPAGVAVEIEMIVELHGDF